MKNIIETELEKFIAENPCADTMEIAEHFYNFGIKNSYAEMRRRESELPPYYGN